MPTFTGGLVGYFSYDYIKYGEQSLNLNANDEEKFNDVDLMLFDKVIAFDNYRQKIILIVNIKVENLEVNYRKAEIELKAMADLIINGKKAEERPLKIKSDYRSYFSKEQYCNMVEKAKEYIYEEGSIFQVRVYQTDLKQKWRAACLDAYRVLRTTKPITLHVLF